MSYLRLSALGIVATGLTTLALAASTFQTATLRDLQTVGTTSKKQKHQQYDLVLDTTANEYVCRTKLGSTLKPTEFVVGTSLQLKLNGQNAEATNIAGTRVKCSIVRVAVAPPRY